MFYLFSHLLKQKKFKVSSPVTPIKKNFNKPEKNLHISTDVHHQQVNHNLTLRSSLVPSKRAVNATYRQMELQSSRDSNCNVLLPKQWSLPRDAARLAHRQSQALVSSLQQRPPCSSAYFYYTRLIRRRPRGTTEALGFSGANITKQAHQAAAHGSNTFHGLFWKQNPLCV